MTQEIMAIKQLPIIEQQLQLIKSEVVTKVSEALSLVVNEDTYKEVKQIRADLNKDFKAFEDQRKEIKKAVLEPYAEFEAIYKDCVSDIFKTADKELAERISEVEGYLKSEKCSKAKDYFAEYVLSKNIDFLTFENIGLTVNMNTSLKSLKTKITEFVDKVSDDLEMIATQEYSAEILVEFKRTLNASRSIIEVNNRHKAIEDEKRRLERLQAIEDANKAKAAQVEQAIIDEYDSAVSDDVSEGPEAEFHAPTTEHMTEKTYNVTFTVSATREQLKRLVDYMRQEDINFEQH